LTELNSENSTQQTENLNNNNIKNYPIIDNNISIIFNESNNNLNDFSNNKDERDYFMNKLNN